MGQQPRPDTPHRLALTCQACETDYWTDTEQTNECPRCGALEFETHGPDGHPDGERQAVAVDLEDPEIVCLCGSTRFKTEYRAENQRLSLAGKIVLSVGSFGHADDIDLTTREKALVDQLHKRKIDLADRVHIIDVDGYIGPSTRSEIEYARRTETPVTWYSQRDDANTDEAGEAEGDDAGADAVEGEGVEG